MIVHKIEICIVDTDEVGAEEISEIIENTKYPNWCISPSVVKIESKDIGEWYDDHPLNNGDTFESEFQRIFKNA